MSTAELLSVEGLSVELAVPDGVPVPLVRDATFGIWPHAISPNEWRAAVS